MWILRNIKLVAMVVLILLLGGSWITVTLQCKRIARLKEDNTQLHNLARHGKQTASTYINLYNRQVNKNHVLELSLRNAQKLRSTEALQHLNQFNGIKNNLSNLKQVIDVQAALIASLQLQNRDTTIIISGDTVRARAFSFQDEYNLIRGHSTPTITSFDSLRFEVPLHGAIVEGRRTKKFIFFRYGPRQLESHITSPNPWVVIDNQLIMQIDD